MTPNDCFLAPEISSREVLRDIQFEGKSTIIPAYISDICQWPSEHQDGKFFTVPCYTFWTPFF